MPTQNEVYEITLTIRLTADGVGSLRNAANELLLSEGLAAGRLQIMNCGPEGTGTGVLIFVGPGGCEANLDDLFAEEPQANLDALFVNEGDTE